MTEHYENNAADAIREVFGFEDRVGLLDMFRRWEDGDRDPITIVDAVELLSESSTRIADAITPRDATAGPCPSGEGSVSSLTEAVMGMTRALVMISESINNVALAIESREQ